MQFFDIDLIQARLKENCFGFEIVDGAAEFAAVKDISSFRAGSVYVVLMREQNGAGDRPQPMTKAPAVVTFGVIAVAKNARDSRGAAAMQDAKEIIGRVREALLGWAPAGCKPCIWLEGSLMDYDRTNLLWADVFTTSHVIGAGNG